jgi:hypothetical protein
VTAHVVLLVLLRHVSAPQLVPSPSSSVTEVIWIEPATPARMDGARSVAPPRATAADVQSPVASSPQAAKVAHDAMQAADGRTRTIDPTSDTAPTEMLVVADDAWAPSPSPRATGRGEIDPAAFERNPLVVGVKDFEAPASVLEAKMRDRSIGAKVQRWFKQGVCARFRQEFRRSPESTNSLVARMRAEGCAF